MKDFKKFFLMVLFISIVFAKIQISMIPFRSSSNFVEVIDIIIAFFTVLFLITNVILGIMGRKIGNKFIKYSFVLWGSLMIINITITGFVNMIHISDLSINLKNQISIMSIGFRSFFSQAMLGFLLQVKVYTMKLSILSSIVFIFPLVANIIGFLIGNNFEKIRIILEKVDQKLKYVYVLSVIIFIENILYNIIRSFNYNQFSSLIRIVLLNDILVIILKIILGIIIFILCYNSSRENNKSVFVFSILYWFVFSILELIIIYYLNKDTNFNEYILNNYFKNLKLCIPFYAAILGNVSYYLKIKFNEYDSVK